MNYVFSQKYVPSGYENTHWIWEMFTREHMITLWNLSITYLIFMNMLGGHYIIILENYCDKYWKTLDPWIFKKKL